MHYHFYIVLRTHKIYFENYEKYEKHEKFPFLKYLYSLKKTFNLEKKIIVC